MSFSTSKEINPPVKADEPGEGGETLRYASDPTPDQAATLPTLQLSAVDPSDSYDGRCRQTLLLAEEAFAKTGSWVIFFREILGIGGIVQQLFSDPDEFKQFTAGPEYATLHEMLAAIRSQDQSKSDAAEPERMITIRIPRSLHELLQEESKASGLSINKLAISKLLWPANPRFIPEQQGRRRGRRPGPQGGRSQGARAAAAVSGPNTSPEEGAGESGHSQVTDRIATHSWADPSVGRSTGNR
jgi:predicted HicB family RNase H-like nuclease